MPNHVYSSLSIYGDSSQINQLIESVKDDESNLSANKIIPMPLEIRDVSSPVHIVSEEEYIKASAQHRFPGAGLPITQNMADTFQEKYGATNWYDWAIDHWGTKWGFYNAGEWTTREGYAHITFESAWSPSHSLIEKLADSFPDLKIVYTYEDEGGAFKCEQTIFKKENINNIIDLEIEENDDTDDDDD